MSNGKIPINHSINLSIVVITSKKIVQFFSVKTIFHEIFPEIEIDFAFMSNGKNFVKIAIFTKFFVKLKLISRKNLIALFIPISDYCAIMYC